MGTERKQVIVDCRQRIPCDPCVDACAVGAIQKEDLNTCPLVDGARCIGCGQCVAACPGQAIFMLEDYGDGLGGMMFPYEFLPLPKVGQQVTAVDGNGDEVGKARAQRVVASPRNNGTVLVTLAMPLEQARRVRGMKRLCGEATHEG